MDQNQTKPTFKMRSRPTSIKGHVILEVIKNGVEERFHPYVSQQMPTDFAEYLMELQEMAENLKTNVPEAKG